MGRIISGGRYFVKTKHFGLSRCVDPVGLGCEIFVDMLGVGISRFLAALARAILETVPAGTDAVCALTDFDRVCFE